MKRVDLTFGSGEIMILHSRSISPRVFEGRAHVLDARAWIEAARATSSSAYALWVKRSKIDGSRCFTSTSTPNSSTSSTAN